MGEGLLTSASPQVRSIAYRLTSGFGIVGLTAGTFSSTVITTYYGGETYGPLVTSVWIVLLVLGRLAVSPYLPAVITRFGVRRTFLTVKVASVVLWIALGSLLALGLVGAPSLYATAPFFGALAAFASTLTTLYSGAYIPGHEMSGALARMAVVRGGAIAVGAAVGALLVLPLGPAWGIIARGAFEVPLILVLFLLRPTREPAAPAAKRQVWKGLVDDLRSNKALRPLIILGMGLTVFAMPFSEMIVPITDQLRSSDIVQGAALMVAAMALGQSFSLFAVNALQPRMIPTRAAAVLGGTRASALLLFAITAVVLSAGGQALVWCVIGLVFGMARAASGAFMAGAATASVSPEDSSRALVAFTFACTAVSPVGVLMWGLLMTYTSVTFTLMVGGVGALFISAFVYGRGAAVRLAT